MKQTFTDIQVKYDEHIPIKYHFLWEQVAEKKIRVEYVGTKEKVAYIFTKPLPWEALEYLC